MMAMAIPFGAKRAPLAPKAPLSRRREECSDIGFEPENSPASADHSKFRVSKSEGSSPGADPGELQELGSPSPEETGAPAHQFSYSFADYLSPGRTFAPKALCGRFLPEKALF